MPTPVTLAQLLQSDTADEVLAGLLTLLAAGGLPTTAWLPGSFPSRTLEGFARNHADALASVSTIAAGVFLDLALERGLTNWITLTADQVFRLSRHPSVFARRRVTLVDAASTGPHPQDARTFYVQTTDGARRYVNVEPFTLTQGGSLPVLFEAELAGASYNLPAGAVTDLGTPLPGVKAVDPGTLVVVGADEESNENLVLRCKARWPSLGSSATELVYAGWALSASAEVRKVRVFENDPADGSVRIVLGGATGGVSPAAIAAVVDYIVTQKRRPLCAKVLVESAVPRVEAVAGVLRVGAAYKDSALGDALGRLTAYQTRLGIGETVFRAQLIEDVMGTAGAINFTPTAPAADAVPAPNEIVTFSAALTVQT